MWLEPELIVLVRGKAEESVLAACKFLVNPSGANAKNWGGCWADENQDCYVCSEVIAS